jgi:hypothetical protein
MRSEKLLPYGEVAELSTVLLRREIFRLTQGGMAALIGVEDLTDAL